MSAENDNDILDTDIRKCVNPECGRDFVLSPGEIEFYKEMMAKNPNFQMPRRCSACRRQRKMEKMRETNV